MTSQSPATVATVAGAALGSMVLAPVGLDGLNNGTGAIETIEKPHLPWLWKTAPNFMEYRVTRASLVVVGLQGSTATGQMTVVSSTDFADIGPTNLGTNAVGGTGFALADLANKNKVVPLRCDTSWKKVSSLTAMVLGNVRVSLSSCDDLLFTTFSYVIAGAPSGDVVTFYIDYDVEFRGPISAADNA